MWLRETPITLEWWKIMIQVLSCTFQQCLGPLACSLSKGVLKCGFLHLYLTTSFGVHNFRNAQGMRVIFVFQKLKIWSRCQKWSKKFKKYFYFLRNCIWIGWYKFSVLRREYLSSAVNVLTNSLKNSDITKRDIFQLFFVQSHPKIW